MACLKWSSMKLSTMRGVVNADDGRAEIERQVDPRVQPVVAHCGPHDAGADERPHHDARPGAAETLAALQRLRIVRLQLGGHHGEFNCHGECCVVATTAATGASARPRQRQVLGAGLAEADGGLCFVALPATLMMTPSPNAGCSTSSPVRRPSSCELEGAGSRRRPAASAASTTRSRCQSTSSSGSKLLTGERYPPEPEPGLDALEPEPPAPEPPPARR